MLKWQLTNLKYKDLESYQIWNIIADFLIYGQLLVIHLKLFQFYRLQALNEELTSGDDDRAKTAFLKEVVQFHLEFQC